MCASRTYFSVKAGALFGNTITPYQRKTEKKLPLKNVFSRGRILNKDLGEYQGTNKIYRELTRKKLSRVFLHSLRGYPQTSCGCFQNLAFWIKEVEGIGIMSRDSEAKAPDGMDWDKLANLAGGKQTDGIMGISTNYIKSRNFLKGDGGTGNIVWVDSDLYKKISGKLMPGQKVATEKDVDTIEELKSFIGPKNFRSQKPQDQ
jgi:acetyl-CoA decarbonylase/synthase complex subunit beta